MSLRLLGKVRDRFAFGIPDLNSRFGDSARLTCLHVVCSSRENRGCALEDWMKVAQCSNCGSTDLRSTTADARGGLGPDLLPGLGSFYRAQFEIVVCCKCGLARLFVSPETIEKLQQSTEWHRA